MKYKGLSKPLSIILTMALLFSSIPFSISAAGAEEATEKTAEEIYMSKMPGETSYAEDMESFEAEVVEQPSSADLEEAEEPTETSTEAGTGEQEVTEEYGERVTYESESAQPQQAEFAGGDGTEASPYLISDYDQLNNMRNYLSSHFKLVNDIEVPEGIGNWIPVGTSSLPFTGTFDGDGHTISSLKVSLTGSQNSNTYGGLFGYVDGGTIKNLGIIASEISANSLGTELTYAVSGGIAGYAEKTVIENSHNNGKILSTSKTSLSNTVNNKKVYAYAGGIVGYALNSNISNCNYNGSVSADSTIISANRFYIETYAYAGGITGILNNSSVINSYNTGDVAANPTSTNYVSSYGYAGGITGYMKDNSLVENCYNAGNISLSPTNCIYTYSGGIAGYADDSSIMNSYNTTSVAIYSNNEAYAGGITGYIRDCVVMSCYNVGNVMANTYSGGVFGYINNSDVKSCYYLNNISVGYGYGSGEVYSCTLDEMKNQITFENFDFESIWIIYENKYSFPVLRSTGIPEIKEEQNTTEFAGGSGTVFDPYKIATKEHLNNVRNYLSSNYILVNNIEFAESDFEENGEYYNDGQYWIPIGTKRNPFFGILNGNGYTVSGLKVNLANSTSFYFGLFGYLKNGKIENLGITDSEITAEKYNKNFYVGAIAGYIDGGIVLNCFNTGEIVANSNTYAESFVAIGGITGYLNNGIIFGCYNSGNLTSNDKNNSYVLASGGIAGYVNSESKISNCYNTGNIGTGNENGGIAGYFNVNCTIINCYNTGMITNFTDESGGIAGYIFFSSNQEQHEIAIKNCYYLNIIPTGIGEGGYGDEETFRCSLEEMEQIETFSGFDFETVWEIGDKTYPLPILKSLGTTKNSFKENKIDFSGGAGTLFNPYRIATKKQLDNVRYYPYSCFVLVNDIEFDESDFSEGGDFYNGGKYWSPIGNKDSSFSGIFDGGGYTISGIKVNMTDSDETDVGLFGCIRNTIIKNLGMSNSDIYIESSESSGYIRAGGIVGYVRDGIIFRCYNTGTVIAKAMTTDINSRAGGIAGEVNDSIVYDCYNNGYIKAHYYLNYSSSYAGGVLGVSYDSEIKTCYNAGNVFSSSFLDESLGTVSGAIYRSTMTDCYYWDKYHVIDQSVEMIAIPCTWDSMMDKETFSGFDFENIWTMGDNTYPLPILKTTGIPEYENEENTVEFAGGTGTVFDPYKISTKEQLNNIRIYPTACFEIVADIEFTESDFSKNGAFYNGGQGWQPIGSEENPFCGFVFGKNHNIDGLKIVLSGSGYKYLGLFGYVRNGIIKDLNITNIDIAVKSSSTDSMFYVGGIAGHSMNTAIADCYSSGKIEGTAVSSSSSIVTGGISGFIDSYSSISNCLNTCNITATATSATSNAYVGGISGYIFGIVEKSSNNGDLISKSSYGKTYAGGIGGNLVGDAIDCDNKGKINGETNASSDTSEEISTYAGGVAGYLGTNGRIINCYNESDVTAKSTSSSSGAYAYGGGISGYTLNADIVNSYNSAAIKSIASATEKTYSRSGGIIGYQSGGSISQCYNSGDINAASSSVNTVYAQSGGVAGLVTNATVKDCYNTGNVAVDIATTTMLSDGLSGGVVGYLSGTLSECYSIGDISAKSTAYNTTAYGAICAECTDDSTVINCYYLDNTLLGIGVGSGDTTVCTINDMQQEGTYFGFDFDTVWTMDGSDSYLLPKLQGIEAEEERILTSIEVSTLPAKTKYYQNKDSLDVSGGKITLYYNDETKEVIDLTEDMVSGFDNTKLGSQTITVTYSGKTAAFEVTVMHAHISDGEWYSDGENHWKVCTDENCGELIEDTKAPHSFEWIIDKQATQNETGLMHEECTVCGFVRNENTEIPVLDHEHFGIEHHDAVAATCHSTGNIEYWTCSSDKCSGKYYSDAQCSIEVKNIAAQIDPDNHEGETELQNAVKETCTEDGYTGDLVCLSCGQIITEGSVIEKHGHVYENGACAECGALDPAFQLGDVNMDGTVNIIDVTSIQIYIAKLENEGKFSKPLADIDKNDLIDILDATSVQKIIAKLI